MSSFERVLESVLKLLLGNEGLPQKQDCRIRSRFHRGGAIPAFALECLVAGRLGAVPDPYSADIRQVADLDAIDLATGCK